MPQPPSKPNPFQDYVSVAERIEKFYQTYPQGRICTSIICHDLERGFILMKAEVYRNAEDTLPAATGHAYEMKSEGYVQRTSYIEVGETSAVGRALAMAGFEVRRGIASREELEKVARFEARQSASKAAPKESVSVKPAANTDAPVKPAAKTDGPATDEQKEEILNLLEELRPKNRGAQRTLLMEKTGKQSRDELTSHEAAKLLAELKQEAPW